MLAPRYYQTDALSALRKASDEGMRRPVVVLPTGMGKTPVACWLIKERGGRALFLAHRDELIQQAFDKFRLSAPELVGEIGIVKAERDERDKKIVIASVQTVSRASRTLPSLWSTVVVDEVHHVAAESYQRVLNQLEDPFVVGFTATPERFDGKPLGFDKIVYSKTLFEGIREGYLCDLRAKQVALKMDLSRVKVKGGDYQEGDLGVAMAGADAPQHIVKAWQEWASGRPTLVFTPTVALAYDTALQFQKAGQRFEVVEGEQKLEDRRAVLKDFSAGRIQGVVNCGVLLEGYDEPSVGCICVARPTKSRVLYQQMVGRGTRVHPAKQDCLILDFVGATTEHDLVTLATLLNVKVSTAEEGVAALLARVAESRQSTVSSTEGEVVAETVDLVTRQKLHWIKDERRYLLSCGDETLALVPGVEGWDIRAIARQRVEGSRALYKGLTLEYAQGVAEDYVRAKGAETLAVGGARWRYQVASEAQLVQLRKAGLAFKPGILKGEASDLLSVHFNRRRW
jgi:ATP-dependent helicase IRC3